MRPSAALAESAIFSPNFRTLRCRPVSNERSTGPCATPPPRICGALRSPTRARPPPFCARASQGRPSPPLASSSCASPRGVCYAATPPPCERRPRGVERRRRRRGGSQSRPWGRPRRCTREANGPRLRPDRRGSLRSARRGRPWSHRRPSRLRPRARRWGRLARRTRRRRRGREGRAERGAGEARAGGAEGTARAGRARPRADAAGAEGEGPAVAAKPRDDVSNARVADPAATSAGWSRGRAAMASARGSAPSERSVVDARDDVQTAAIAARLRASASRRIARSLTTWPVMVLVLCSFAVARGRVRRRTQREPWAALLRLEEWPTRRSVGRECD